MRSALTIVLALLAPSVCSGPRIHGRFCVDRDECVAPGESLPMSNASWSDARAVCERHDKRLCNAHDEHFRGLQTGVRCCANPRDRG